MATQPESVELVGRSTTVNITRAALFAALMGAFAYVTFPSPLSPVPVTLQVLGVFLAGILLGPIWGGASMCLYLVAGALGAPVFAGGSAGLAPLLSESAGYLYSYPIAAALVGVAVHRGRDLRDPTDVGVPILIGSMVAGTAVIYLLGITSLMIVLDVGPIEAFLLGAAAFIPVEALKIAAAVGIVRSDSLTVA